MSAFQNVFLGDDSLRSLTEPKPKTFLEPQHQPAYDAWKKKQSDDTRDALLKSLSPVIDYHVRSVGNADKNYLTIQGKILAMRAMDKYDPAQASLATYMAGQLAPLRRFARQQMNVMSIPERLMMATQQMEGAEVELEDQLGRAPTTEELADHMKMSIKQITRMRQLSHARNTGSYDTPDEEGGMSSPTVRRKIPQKYLHDFVLSALESDPISQFIYEADNGLNGRQPLSNKELSSKLRISMSAVSQRRNRIIEIYNNTQERLF